MKTEAQAAEARALEEYFARLDPVDVAAADWHTRWEQGLNAADQAGFAQWLAASPAHASAYASISQATNELRSIPAEGRALLREAAMPAVAESLQGATLKASQAARQGSGPARHRKSRSASAMQADGLRSPAWRSRWPAVLACCCMLLLAVGGYRWLQLPRFEGSYAAQRGQRQSVTLPDGSVLSMDAETQAHVVYYRDRREVRIAEGQIVFAVTPDDSQPFHVLAGPARVTVVGTRFSVRYRHAGMDAGAVKVAVEEGHVRVANGARAMAPIDLLAGQGLTMTPDGSFGAAVAAEPGSIGLWRKGLVRFDNTSLAEALAEMERYGASGLVIRDPAVASMTIGGTYAIDRPGDFARMVAQILPVRLVGRADGQTEIVRAR